LQKELKRLFNRSNNVGSTSKGAVGLGLGSSAPRKSVERLKKLNSKDYPFLPQQNLSKW